MENIEQTSLEIKERFAKVNVQIQEKDITERLSILVNKFRVPINEARRNVTSHFRRVHNINQDEFFATAGFANQSPVKIAELIEDNKWCTFNARVAVLWDPRHEKILQTGVLGDETGTIVFTTWKSTGGSGLIKRCPECHRSLSKGSCAEHGKVEGIYDLRIKGVIDDGVNSRDVILNRKLTEELTGITLDKAKEIATESLDAGTVADEMGCKVIGHYFEVTGVQIDKNLIVETIKPFRADVKSQINVLLAATEA